MNFFLRANVANFTTFLILLLSVAIDAKHSFASVFIMKLDSIIITDSLFQNSLGNSKIVLKYSIWL